MITIYHNARCSKSRDCLAFIGENETEFEIVEYLKTPLKSREIKTLLRKLKLRPIEIVRKKEPEWQPFKNQPLTDDEIVKILVKHPILIERPIVATRNIAVVARPVEKAAWLLSQQPR